MTPSSSSSVMRGYLWLIGPFAPTKLDFSLVTSTFTQIRRTRIIQLSVVQKTVNLDSHKNISFLRN